MPAGQEAGFSALIDPRPTDAKEAGHLHSIPETAFGIGEMVGATILRAGYY